MSKEKETIKNMRNVGNFTKEATREFEENIVKQEDFLRRVDIDLNKNK